MAKALFVAVGHDGYRSISEDGRTWSTPVKGKEGEVYRCVCIAKERIVAIGSYGGDNLFAYATADLQWQTFRQDAKYSKYIRGLGFGAGLFVGLGGDPASVGISNPFVQTSLDGKEWSVLMAIPGKNMLRRVAYGNERFVAVGDRGQRGYSLDGKTWQDLPKPVALDTCTDICFGNGYFVGVGLHGLRMRSKTGERWEDRQRGEEGDHINSVLFTEKQFVAVGAQSTYMSSDGMLWARKANQNAPLIVAYGNGVFVGANWKGRMLYSVDAINWQEVHRFDAHIEAISYGTI